jgi:GH15 family glucan-1,4-alpha-glucosidase
VRNWDYRYCWLRDSVLTLNALLAGGYSDEALAFRDFVLRVATGDPAAMQIMFGVGGERRLTEFELPHLPGYEGSRPVRVGNAASEQFQLDVYGELAAVGAILRSTATSTRLARCSSACSASPTISGCWPRSTTSSAAARSATSPRPSATSRS